jgi:hypothetical protein
LRLKWPAKITIVSLIKEDTVKLVLRGHHWDKEKVALQDRWLLERCSIHMKFSMTGQERVTF